MFGASSLRRLLVVTTAWLLLLVAVPSGTAAAQEDSVDSDEEAAEPSQYGDAELIEALRTYGLLDEWVAASPVSPQASLLLVTSGGSYQAQRQTFLNSLDAWAARTEGVRSELARVDAAQLNADGVRAAITQVRDALVLDDRLASNSTSLVQIDDALGRLTALAIPEPPPSELEDPLTLAELRLAELRGLAVAEVTALNGSEAAVSSSGVGAFVGFDDLLIGLGEADGLIGQGRRSIQPALDESERLAASALRQIPSLHSARLLGATDVDGLSVVTVDAYIRAAARSSCSVDWALLAGIGRIESNHGRLGGASVAGSGRVSTTILGPLLDGGQTALSEATGRASELAAHVASASPLWNVLRFTLANTPESSDGDGDAADASEEPLELGNGFEVVVDTDNGQLDGNDQWDRAVGPMQFLPETWSKWATDGSGDGVADPNNLYDAATSAARFLCNLSATRGSSPSTFVLGYNSSRSYVQSVLATAQRLRGKLLPAP